MDTTELRLWLDQEPLETDIFQKGFGFYIPIEIIKPRLDILDPSWSTKNYKHLFFGDHDGRLFCSGSVDLSVKYLGMERTIVGAATFPTSEYTDTPNPNFHFGQTCLSLCIVAAAKEIGKFFGKDLNKISVEQENKILNTISNLPK